MSDSPAVYCASPQCCRGENYPRCAFPASKTPPRTAPALVVPVEDDDDLPPFTD